MRSSIGAIWNFAFVVMDAFIVSDHSWKMGQTRSKSEKKPMYLHEKLIGCTMWRTKCRFEEKVVGVVSADKEKNFTKYQIVVVQFVPTLANLGLRPSQFWKY